jgi:hypothetical protein
MRSRKLERVVKISNREPRTLAALGHAYGAFGQNNQALMILAELRNRSNHANVSPEDFAIVYSGLRDNDGASLELQRAARQGLSSLYSLKTAPEYDSLRRDPRFADLLRSASLDRV